MNARGKTLGERVKFGRGEGGQNAAACFCAGRRCFGGFCFYRLRCFERAEQVDLLRRRSLTVRGLLLRMQFNTRVQFITGRGLIGSGGIRR
jgi:hypothetical protein